LGADIPFCLMSTTHGAMTAQGIGEMLTPAVPLPPSCHLVVACHGEGVSTPWAYRSLDERGGGFTFERAEQQNAAFTDALATEQLDTLAAHSHNYFENVVLPERPQAAFLMQLMEQSGACLLV
jgi:4-diphosphocytidyl-2C-methyl-D-erythritol kinase